MLLKSKVIHKNNKYREFEPNPHLTTRKHQKCGVPNYPQNFVISGKCRISKSKKN
jgi:hypothetical protein